MYIVLQSEIMDNRLMNILSEVHKRTGQGGGGGGVLGGAVARSNSIRFFVCSKRNLGKVRF